MSLTSRESRLQNVFAIQPDRVGDAETAFGLLARRKVGMMEACVLLLQDGVLYN